MSASASDPRRPRPNVIRRLYDWVLHFAETPYGLPALVILAIAESSIFPIPPDILLIALCLATPRRSWRYAAWTTLGSVFGGVIGYAIGWGFWASAQPLFIPHLFSIEQFSHVATLYNEYGVACIFVAAFTVIPYKIFTISAGVADLNLIAFAGASIVGRGARFFLVALMIRRYGYRARELIEKYFNVLTIFAAILLVGGFLLIKVLLSH